MFTFSVWICHMNLKTCNLQTHFLSADFKGCSIQKCVSYLCAFTLWWRPEIISSSEQQFNFLLPPKNLFHSLKCPQECNQILQVALQETALRWKEMRKTIGQPQNGASRACAGLAVICNDVSILFSMWRGAVRVFSSFPFLIPEHRERDYYNPLKGSVFPCTSASSLYSPM